MSHSSFRRVSILGSTGSIGTNTLAVIRQHLDRFKVSSLSCGNSIDTLLQQIAEFNPEAVSVGSVQVRDDLLQKLSASQKNILKIFVGPEGHAEMIQFLKPDVLMAAMSDTHGLLATIEAIRCHTSVVGIANKEVLVMAGSFILNELKNSKSKLIPVDSEHSAIFQALMGNNPQWLKKIILTASGGPFRTRDLESFESITKQEALRHPNWVMGQKITVDSATMMNKGLEFIEAIRLFNVTSKQIEVLIHPESVVHSLVEYQDGSLMAQLGISDMKIPISLALGFPDRLSLQLDKKCDLAVWKQLRFEEPDFLKFPCLKLAIESVEMGDHGPIILNAANEIAVQRFLSEEIGFMDIPSIVALALQTFQPSDLSQLEAVLALDKEVKAWAKTAKPVKSRVGSQIKVMP